MADMEAHKMAREMTPQERAAAFIKSTFPLHLREDGEPCDGDIEDVVAHDKETRRAALLEAAQVIPRNWLDPLLKGVRTSSCPEIEQLLQSIKVEIDRLAQEG